MSSLARWFLAQNWRVSGSDVAESQITESLSKSGVNVKIGHTRANLPLKPDVLVYSQAIKTSNPELSEAKRQGILRLSYPEAVGRLSDPYITIGVAGAHGKSTTTAMAALLLIEAGFDPTVILGTKLTEFGGTNFRLGKSSYLVLEADEYGRAFLNYSPAFTIITNIDREHLDTYRDLGDIKRTFLTFISRTRKDGAVILNGDDKNLRKMKPDIIKIARRKHLRLVWFSLAEDRSARIKKVLKVPGSHNLANALAVFHLGQVLGVKETQIMRSLGAYRGAWRRMEVKGNFKGAPVYDDYAHHPTEIKATLKAFKEKYPEKKIMCVFQPHQAKRLEKLFPEFVKAFVSADEIIVLPLYKVAGRDGDYPQDAKALARAVKRTYPKKEVLFLEKPEDIVSKIVSFHSPLPSKVIVMMGAGTVAELTEKLI